MAKKSDKHILVVEDDVDLCEAITMAVQKDGFTAFGVHTIRDAGFKLKNQAYACILLDMRLGEELGETLIDLIRSRADYQNLTTPIIVISGFLDKDLILEIREKINGALVKPFETKAILEMINRLAL